MFPLLRYETLYPNHNRLYKQQDHFRDQGQGLRLTKLQHHARFFHRVGKIVGLMRFARGKCRLNGYKAPPPRGGSHRRKRGYGSEKTRQTKRQYA